MWITDRSSSAAQILIGTLIAVLHGCGGGGGSAAPGPTSSAPGTPSTSATTPKAVASSLKPLKVELTDAVLAVTTGWAFSCASTADGRTHCWGANNVGQLGVEESPLRCGGGNFQCSGTPQDSGLDVLVESLIAAGPGTCALSGSAPICWGFGTNGPTYNGQLGQPLPPTVLPVSFGIEKLTASPSGYAFCGLRIDTHELVCWNGSVLRGESSALDISFAEGTAGIAFSSVSLGELHACGIDTRGTALCWGNNWYGQLGVGSAGGNGGLADAASPVAVTGGLSFTQLVAGGSYTCGLTTSGRAYCWGYPDVADGGVTQTDVTEPIAVAGNFTFDSIYAGFAHACGLDVEGHAYCWGANTGGGTSFLPSAIPGNLQFDTLALGGPHSCGITRDAQLYCWGENYSGQLGRPPGDN